MKYETVFGDQSLFDGCDDETASIVIATSNGRKFVAGEFTKYGIVEGDVKSDGLRIAMRRIIEEPKRWTWEDKRAGRLPEVGCDIQYIESQKRVSVIAINSNEVVLLAKSNGSKFFVLDPDSLLQYYNPVETPEEKAQREEDEFISSLSGADIQDGTVKDFFAQGARAAYRKLKGGE